MNCKAESTSRTESETGHSPQYKTPLPGRWLTKEAGLAMAQKAGDLGWRESATRAWEEGLGA